jgi:TonB-dependent receptor
MTTKTMRLQIILLLAGVLLLKPLGATARTGENRDFPADALTERMEKGIITGSVLDRNGQPIPGATVQIIGTTNGTATDARGNFILKDVPEQAVTVEIRCISYATLRISDITVRDGQKKQLNVVLQDDAELLDEVLITATYNQASANGLYAKQKAMTAMSDGVSADLIKKTSDNNVAQVLKRVSGVTIDNGKYVVVRGMSERYNNVQLNGSSLPSTEPNRRNFSFDVIPTALIDNVTIAKTFTPDLQGEFTGGLVEVRTLSVPDEQFVNISLGTGMNTQSTGKDFLSTQRYSGDYLFGEIDKRQWYAGKTEEDAKVSLVNAAEKNGYGFRRYTAAPLQNYSLTAGIPLKLKKGHKLGLVAALTYRNEQTTEDILEGKMITSDSIYSPGHRYTFVTAAGAVANIGWEKSGHKITWHNLYNSRFTHTNTERSVYDYYDNSKYYEQYSRPLASRLLQTQLDGEHTFFKDKLIFTWNVAYNTVERTNPDDRLATGGVAGETADGRTLISWGASTTDSNGFNISDSHIMYSRLSENKKNIGGNLEYPFVVEGNRQRLKAGYLGTFRRADFQQQYLKAMGWPEDIGVSIYDYFAPENFGANGPLTYVISGMQAARSDYYEGRQDIHAAYVMGEFTFLRRLHLTAGVRMEKAGNEVLSKLLDTSGNATDSIVTQKNTDWLPAVTLVYNVTDNTNVRLAYSRTLARPDFRELSRTAYYNVDDRIYVFNRKPLEQSTSDNYDLRFEWYPQLGEVVSVSGFIKKFRNPVEMVTQMESSQQRFNMYSVNLDEATVKGVEINVRKSLGFLATAPFLQDLYISGNAALISGDVNYTAIRNEENKRKRPLMGLAPYTVNAGLAYQGKALGAAVNYGRVGRTLVMSGDYEKYDQYEHPRNVLDLQLSARFLRERLELKFNASDLLNEDIIVYRNCSTSVNYKESNKEPDKAYTDRTGLGMDYNEGDWVMSRIRKGVNLSLSASYRF